MVHVTRSIEIEGTPDDIWAVISRFAHTNEYSPLVVRVEMLSTNDTGVGAKRKNYFENGSSITEEAVAWVHNKSQTIKGSDFGSLPLKDLTAQLDVRASGANTATLIWALDFKPKFGPIGWLMGQLMMKSAFGKVVQGNLDAVSARVAKNRGQATA